MSFIEARNLSKTYLTRKNSVKALSDVTFCINPGAFVTIVGPAGSGKSTLLNMIGCLDSPTKGSLNVAGHDVTRFGSNQSTKFRNSHIGFIFHNFNLIPMLTVSENIEYPLRMVHGWPDAQRKKRVEDLLEIIALVDEGEKYPHQISAGQQQQVAIARALATNARLVLADEPTANLRPKAAAKTISLMKKVCGEFGTTVVRTTGTPHTSGDSEMTFHLNDGVLQSH